ncbi:MAG: hypothetical protein V1491_02055 [archaeon]
MPINDIHCKISEKRTKGDPFKELHQWMDEASEYIGTDHRLERHFYTEEYKNYIAKRWSDKAVVEWLFHIAIDNIETANKFAIDAYKKSYKEIRIKFNGEKISECSFIKTNSKGEDKCIKISVNENGEPAIDKAMKAVEEPKKKPYKFYGRYKKK